MLPCSSSPKSLLGRYVSLARAHLTDVDSDASCGELGDVRTGARRHGGARGLPCGARGSKRGTSPTYLPLDVCPLIREVCVIKTVLMFRNY